MIRSVLALALAPSILAISPVEVVNKLHDAFRANDPSWVDLLHEDVVFTSNSPQSAPICTHHEGKSAFLRDCVARIPDVLPGFALGHTEEIFGEGENVYARVKTLTTAGGEMGAFGQHFKVRDGKIIEFFDHQDTAMMSTVSDRASHALPATVVKQAYKYFGEGDIDSFLKLLDPNMKFQGNIPKGMPCSGPYLSPQEWMSGCITKIPETWPGFKVVPIHVFSEGAYVFATVQATSLSGMDTLFGHRFKVINGLIVDFYDFADTLAQVKANKAKEL